MDNQEQKGKELNKEQLEKLRQGMALKEMTGSEGWKIFKTWLEARAFHAWVDPRGLNKEEWEWAELNAFHSHDVAKQLMLDLGEAIQEADQLENLRLGKDQPTRMKI